MAKILLNLAYYNYSQGKKEMKLQVHDPVHMAQEKCMKMPGIFKFNGKASCSIGNENNLEDKQIDPKVKNQ
jgi:hypothetical protein